MPLYRPRYRRSESRKLKAFPDSLKTEDNQLLTLYASRLLFGGQLWKTLDTESIERMLGDVPILRELIQKCNELTQKYEKSRKEQLVSDRKERMAWIEEEKDANAERGDFFYDSRDLPETVGDRIQRLKELTESKLTVDKQLEKSLKKLERSAERNKNLLPAPLEKNLELIANLFGLNRVETNIFAFLLYLKISDTLQTIANVLDYSRNTIPLICGLVARATLENEDLVREALSENGQLVNSGLICFGNRMGRGDTDAEDCYEILFEDMIPFLTLRTVDKSDLYKNFLTFSEKAKLCLDDFVHVPEIKEQVLPALTDALKKKKSGCNILFFGASGTGKTELTRAIAEHFDMRLFSVGTEGKSGGKDRLDCLKSASKVLAKTNDTLLAVDECDDIFNSGFGLFFFPVRTNKGKIVDVLEHVSRPTLWTCNSIQMMDDALLRRFDLIIEMPSLDSEQRAKIFRQKLGSEFSDWFIESISENDQVSLAMLDRAVEVASTFGKKSQQDKEAAITKLLNQTLSAQGRTLLRDQLSSDEKPYDVSCVNTSVDLIKLADGLKNVRKANICLYGAPGTGKSAYVRWLAKQLKKPIVVKRASDLLNCYVGNTEKNIAGAFQEARRKKAILVLDEADSFFRDRKLGSHSWEVSQVNEILTQMENFGGFFIATTNLMDDMDEASLRRFDLKAEFKWLKDNQKIHLLNLYGKKMGLESEPSEEDIRRLKALDALSPGDFSNLFAQNAFSPIASYSDFVSKLSNEQKMKRSANQNSPIGFT